MQSHEPESWIWRFRGSKTLNRLHLWSSKLIPLFLSPCNKRYKRHLPSDSMLVRKINQNISTHYNMYEMFAWGKGVGIFCCTAYIMIVESFTKNMSHCAEWNWFVNQPLQADKKTTAVEHHHFWPTAPQQLRNWHLVLSGIDLHATSPKPFSKFEIGNTSVPKKYEVYPQN